MKRKYFTLMVREGGEWNIAFGDYSREVVEDERDDYRQHHRAKDLKIVSTADWQPAILAALQTLRAAS